MADATTSTQRDDLAGTLKRSALSAPGYEVVQILTEIPAGALDLGPETGQMLSTSIVEVGEPLATAEQAPA